MSFGGPEVVAGLFGLGGPELAAVLIVAILLYGISKQLRRGTIVGYAGVGAVVGAILGYLFRPSVPLIGQLPFITVLTRGANLTGMDLIVRPVAEESFNYLVIGAIVCGAIMAVMRYMMLQNATKQTVSASTAPPPPAPIAAAAAAPAGNSFCTACGTPLADGITFCGKCGTKRG
jgi:hypothetical protein